MDPEAASALPDLIKLINQEFAEWRKLAGDDDTIVLLDVLRNEDGGADIKILLQGEHEVSMICPPDYPNHDEKMMVKLDRLGSGISLWCNELNEFILDSPKRLSFADILTRAIKLPVSLKTFSSDDDLSDSDGSANSSLEPEEESFRIDDNADDEDEGFTTQFELDITRKKKRWLAREKELKSELEKSSNVGSAIQLGEGEKSKTNQIFSDTASSGVLINDLVNIIKTKTETGISAEPVDDNIYAWSVRVSKFLPESELSNDLSQLQQKYEYDYIELELTFAINVYPFYPPLITVIRPLMKNSLMQRISNLEIIKLSFWNPAKDMKSILLEIKAFMQDWVRIDVDSERNDPRLFPSGSYLHIEHHLLRLAQTSETSPRANLLYNIKGEKLPKRLKTCQKTIVGKWKKGTGYGTDCSRSKWDINAYVAAQKEKDKQIENVLVLIIQEISRMLRNSTAYSDSPISPNSQSPSLQQNSGDTIVRLYEIIEGSCLLPFVKGYLNTDSILEISKHTVVFQKIFQIIDLIASNSTLVNLLGPLPGDDCSAFESFTNVYGKATDMVQRLSSASSSSQSDNHSFAETIIEFYNRVKEHVERSEFKSKIMASAKEGGAHDKSESVEELLYTEKLKPMQFHSINIPVTGTNAHHFSSNSTNVKGSKKQILRIAQELSSFKSSLPLNRSSSVFVRTDDSNISLMQALITGPEGSPYSGGCYSFDILFPSTYPEKPPKVNLQTTGKGTVRFNPNLYANGKVCLSLLGTWDGQEGEKWNIETSTILQVLVSIQSLILVPDPFFNEPGFERQIGTPEGEKRSREYNLDVMINNLKYAMLDQIRNPPHGFEDVITTHFSLKKNQILRECQEWLENNFASHPKRSEMESVFRELKNLLGTLTIPVSDV